MIPTIEIISATEITPNHHRNDPHDRNDTGGHHRNDPRNIGNGIKRTTKTGQQFSACILFIYIASLLQCVIYLLPHFNTRQYLLKRCNSLMSSIVLHDYALCYHDYALCYHLMCAKIVFGVRNDLTQSTFIT